MLIRERSLDCLCDLRPKPDLVCSYSISAK